MMLVCYNGDWIPQKDINIQIFNRAFKYGDSLFESFVVKKNTWIFLEDHFQRLYKGAQYLGYKIPHNFQKQLEQVVNTFPSESMNGHGRLMLFRNGKGKYTPENNTISWLIEFTPSSTPFYIEHSKGLTIDLCENIVLLPTVMGNYKTGSAAQYVIASNEKVNKKMDDLLLQGPAKNIVETTNANIFIRKENQIYTPPLSQGCLSGIIRKKLIDLVKQESKYELRLEPLAIEDIHNADEIWLTNVSLGIRWVQKFRNSNFARTDYSFWIQKLNGLVLSQIKEINV